MICQFLCIQNAAHNREAKLYRHQPRQTILDFRHDSWLWKGKFKTKQNDYKNVKSGLCLSVKWNILKIVFLPEKFW